MKSFLVGLLAVALLPLALAQPPAQPVKPEPVKHGRGHKPPSAEVVRQRHAAAFRRHDHRMRAQPVATASSYDCRTLGVVPPVVDQGSCGSCWDFSGSGMVTSALIKAGCGKADGSFRISEQYVLDCGSNGGCNGDDNVTVLDMAKKAGLPTEAQYGPYRAREGRCQSNASMQMYKILDWGFCTPSQEMGVASTQDIKNAMVQYGPIGCAVAADGMDGYQPGTVFAGNSRNIDHDVILVGWDDAKGKNGAWLMRNSWGTSWGDGGYMWIAYGANEIGTEAVWCTAAPLPPPPAPPVPPGPSPPGPGPAPVPGSVTTITLSSPLPAGTFELATAGTAAGLERLAADVAALQSLGKPGCANCEPPLNDQAAFVQRLDRLEMSVSRITDSILTLQKLLGGGK